MVLEYSELRKMNYSEYDLNNLNHNNVLLEEPYNINNKNRYYNKQYLIDELHDITKIKEVSIKLKNNETDLDSAIEELKIKPDGDRNSIFVEALQSIAYSRQTKSSIKLNNKVFDGSLIRPSTMLEAHIACGDEISNLPRIILNDDKKIKIGSDFFNMFRAQYEKVFHYNLLIEENVPKTANQIA